MDTPRTRRSRAPICYKEDSFVEEDVKNITRQSVSKKFTRQSISKKESNPVKINKVERLPECVVNLFEISSQKDVYNSDDDFKDSKFSPLKSTTPRRGNRIRRKTALIQEAEETTNRLKKLTVESSGESSDEFTNTTLEKPTDLFTDDDVEGKKMFGFKISHRKKNLLKKAIETALDSPSKVSKDGPRVSIVKFNPATPKRRGRPPSLVSTPKSTKAPSVEKTPHHIRNKIKKKLKTIVQSDSDGTDFSDSGSEFNPSESSDSDESIKSKDSKKLSSSEDEEEIQPKKPVKVTIHTDDVSKPYSLRTRGEKSGKFFMKSDDYFTMQGSKKIVTSNRTLDRLKNPRMTEDNLKNILKSREITKEHRNAIKELIEDAQNLFNKWLFALSEGFSILLYGVGSKIKLIQQFQQNKLSSYPCIVINGFFPSLTLKDILDSIIIETLELSNVPSNANEAISLVEEEMASMSEMHLFILVHNIDGPMLKNSKIQHVLSKLSKINNVHMVASLDHVNGPLIWDHMKLRDFNFSWWDVTTFLPYSQETSFESSLMVHKSGALALSSLQNVFFSLTTNAKGIFMIIAKNQLKNKKIPHYQGISFKELYWSARESFLVSSDLALRAQLTEFLDHKLVKNKRTLDGVENLIIPIDNTLLQQFTEQNESK